ncbi:hypothetical protein [Oceanirhabdus seepicola]|uniref:Uncharacterized protein n=1 Tax=Oceanirhabdus seepicola TaxID=2828781 RepID=A0A9J6P6W0_9CLOT|nr:hypothetical protein [Oceanirhabdus seepicola]MCM1991549.1 hypothetical protein [Oceanirhabdus seepicola]
MKPKNINLHSYRNGVIAFCFVLIVAVIFILLLKNNVTRNENLERGLNNNTNEAIDNTKHSEDRKNNFNNEQMLENNLISNEELYSEDAELEECSGKVIDENSVKELSKEEAYSLEGYEMFLPKTILKGYKFRSANIYNMNSPSEVLSVGYESGYSYVDIHVRVISPDDENRMVKVSEREKYDITKYPIPHASSIPEELYYTMNYPIFQWEETTEEVLQLRKVSYMDHGEDGKMSETMRFTIQCGNFLVDYNIKGKPLQTVYDMVTSADFFELNR